MRTAATIDALAKDVEELLREIDQFDCHDIVAVIEKRWQSHGYLEE